MHTAKEPFVENDPDLVAQALAEVLDSRNYPLLIHSNKGKHRWFNHQRTELIFSGVVVGCLRKLQGWSLASIFNEYDRYAQGKGESDLQVPPALEGVHADDVVQFIENFDKKIEFDTQHKPAWMP